MAGTANMPGSTSASEIINNEVGKIDENLKSFMRQKYWEAFEREQRDIIGRILQHEISTTVAFPLIFSTHLFNDLDNTIHYPVITKYKYFRNGNFYEFRTVFIQIDEWCVKDFYARRIDSQRVPLLFRQMYEYDFFICADSADFEKAQILQRILTKSAFRVWWPAEHTEGRDATLPELRLQAGLAKSRIAAVLIGANGRGRWGKGALDKALYNHCELRKPIILFLLPSASNLKPDECLGEKYKTVLPEPLYLNWPGNEVIEKWLNDNLPSSFPERIMTEVVKLLRLENPALDSDS